MEDRKRINTKALESIGKSWHLGTFFDIPVKIHWSFGILVFFVSYTILTNEMKLWQGVAYALLVLFVFVCVVLHEYGHALTAKKFGVDTLDIIVSPIGGVARMKFIPDKPAQEFLITLNGPLVNLILGILIGVVMYFVTGKFSLDLSTYNLDDPLDFVRLLSLVNFTLFFFNLIPAFPMDGGRILRSLLALKYGKVKATRIASFVGRVFAIGFVIFGVFDQQLMLSLIGIFIYMMAGQEYSQTKLQSIIGDVTVRDIMRTSFTRLHLGDTYSKVTELYKSNGEHNFLVFDSMGNLSGNVPELFIQDVIESNDMDKSVNEFMSDKRKHVSPAISLQKAISIMRDQGIGILSVVEDDVITGVIDRNDIEAYIRSKID
ncbi:MAG TPA: site-2 protease family protein [Saprospiraceae bacterium]|nr:site-2 protease family protein [Saprospiraceae bacterium]HRO08258.1 site-2 protease family protein [Saprospiraceae bacterium]HRP41149.1 site-2 protease family protein [Saprospiraceae bacterium]